MSVSHGAALRCAESAVPGGDFAPSTSISAWSSPCVSMMSWSRISASPTFGDTKKRLPS